MSLTVSDRGFARNGESQGGAEQPEANEVRAEPHVRREFLRRVAVTAGVIPVISGTTLLATKPAAASQETPLPELFAGWNARNFVQIQADENAHVEYLANALGASSRPSPTFQNLQASSVQEFAALARTFENTGAAAYLAALPVLASTQLGLSYLAAAGSIALVEARHAGYLNSLLNLSLVENITNQVSSFDVPLPPDQVVTLVSPFIASLNGGPPVIPAGGLSNAIDILNFALVLECLEAEFYNINLPIFFSVLSR